MFLQILDCFNQLSVWSGAATQLGGLVTAPTNQLVLKNNLDYPWIPLIEGGLRKRDIVNNPLSDTWTKNWNGTFFQIMQNYRIGDTFKIISIVCLGIFFLFLLRTKLLSCNDSQTHWIFSSESQIQTRLRNLERHFSQPSDEIMNMLSEIGILGTRGAVLHHSAETVLCFRNQVVLLSCCLVALSKYQSLERKPAYGVERAFHNHSC